MMFLYPNAFTNRRKLFHIAQSSSLTQNHGIYTSHLPYSTCSMSYRIDHRDHRGSWLLFTVSGKCSTTECQKPIVQNRDFYHDISLNYEQNGIKFFMITVCNLSNKNYTIFLGILYLRLESEFSAAKKW